MNDTATEVVVTPETLPPMAWQQAKVITTDLLARLYGTKPDNIQRNFERNSDKFVLGKHFFRLDGESLSEFKNYPAHSRVVPKRTRHLIIWTERGAARHAKMLDTPEAWEVFEKLEDCYFAIQQIAAGFRPEKTRTALPGALTIEQQDAIKQLVKAKAEQHPQDKRGIATIKMWSALKSKFGVGYKEIPSEHFTDALSLVARLEPLEGELMEIDEPKFKVPDRDYQTGRSSIDNIRNWAARALQGQNRENILAELDVAERSLVHGWTEMDEAIMSLLAALGMLRRWRNK